MATCVPALAKLTQLPTPLNDGERSVLEVLLRLEDSWEIYVQPQLGTMEPDFVLAHDRFGVIVLEVKDWDAHAYRRVGKVIEVHGGSGWTSVGRLPRRQAQRYQQGLFESFYALPESQDEERACVRSLLIFPRLTDEQAHELNGPAERIEIGGAQFVATLARTLQRSPARPPRQQSLKKLRRQLGTSEFRGDQMLPLSLSKAAQAVADNANQTKIRRVRGPAGSGKSLAIAARAVNIAHANHAARVLVLHFNITLRQYLHDLMARHARHLNDGLCTRRITITHIDDFLSSLLDDLPEKHVGGSLQDWSARAVQRLTEAFQEDTPKQYDAILIDEGQDFRLDQWNLLRLHLLRPGGEILLAADASQDVYGTSGWTEESSMLGAGFSGPWARLEGTYRLPLDLTEIVADYAQRVLPEHGVDLPRGAADHPGRGQVVAPTFRAWINTERERAATALADVVERLLAEHESLAEEDIVVLTEEHRLGRTAMDLIQSRGQRVSHVFGRNDSERERRKKRFWGGAAGLKGCTMHSFKGWEARAVVMLLSGSSPTAWPVLSYTAITRVKGDPEYRSAFVTVVNTLRELDDFKTTFERDVAGQGALAFD